MADYKQQQMVEAANAVTKKRRLGADKEMADASAKEETARYSRALDNKAGAGRGAQGGPTAKELKSAGQAFAKGGKVSTASRGDGAAQRGKTKGRMC